MHHGPDSLFTEPETLRTYRKIYDRDRSILPGNCHLGQLTDAGFAQQVDNGRYAHGCFNPNRLDDIPLSGFCAKHMSGTRRSSTASTRRCGKTIFFENRFLTGASCEPTRINLRFFQTYKNFFYLRSTEEQHSSMVGLRCSGRIAQQFIPVTRACRAVWAGTLRFTFCG